MFNPIRLEVARKRRQMTKKALAQAAGVSQLTITRLAKGDTPNPDVTTVDALSVALNYPRAFFFLDDCEVLSEESVSFRSLSAMTGRQRDAALASGAVAFTLDEWVTDRFNLPPADLPNLRDEDPSAAAAALRTYWGIGSKPIPHMTKLLEAKGVRVFSLSESNKNVDAFSCWRNDVPYVFLNTLKSAERSRFDAAHELGHLVLHVHGASGSRDVEREADAFASALLIPKDDLVSNLKRLPSLQDLIAAKSRWGVSVAALARSAFQHGMLSDWYYRDLCKSISANGYRTKEPQPRPREESVLWKKVFESLWRERMTKDYVARELSIPVDEIESLLGGLYGDVTTTAETARVGLRSV